MSIGDRVTGPPCSVQHTAYELRESFVGRNDDDPLSARVSRDCYLGAASPLWPSTYLCQGDSCTSDMAATRQGASEQLAKHRPLSGVDHVKGGRAENHRESHATS